MLKYCSILLLLLRVGFSLAQTADFTMTPSSGCSTPHTVFFTDQSSGADQWDWDFGDGGTSTAQNPIYTYTTGGVWIVTLTVTNTTTMSTDVYTDSVVITMPTSDFSVDVTSGCAPVDVNFTDLSSTTAGSITGWDWNFGDGNSSTSQNPSHTYTVPGTYTVTLEVTDDNGCTNTSTQSALIDVNGITANFSGSPTTGCPGETISFTDISTYNASASSWEWDFGDGNTSTTQNPNNTYNFQGTYDIEFIAFDSDGCSDTIQYSSYVTILDNTPPTITCPGNQNVVFDSQCRFQLQDYIASATATDDCPLSTVTITQSPAAGGYYFGNTTVTLTANDGNGNTSTCSFSIIPSDTTAPTISCPGNQSDYYDSNCQFTLPDYTSLANTTDNCGTVTVSQVPAPGTLISGPTTITLVASDPDNNQATCTFSISLSDTTKPSLTCPANQSVSFDSNCEYTLLDYTSLATVSDNCSPTTITQNPAAGTLVSTTTNIVLTATDTSGNTVSCNFDVIPTDQTAPIFTCPSNDTTFANSACTATIPEYASSISATDNCDLAPTVTQSPTAGSTANNTGTNLITIYVTDAAGNVDSCSFNLIVIDTISPVIECGTDMITCEPVVTFPTPQASDNCGNVTVIQTAGLPSGSTYPIGTTTNTFLATDDFGNTDSCSFNVTITEEPTVTGTGTDVTCNGDSDGSIDITAGNGTQPFSYAWSNGSNSEDINGLAAGQYTITVTDSVGCTLDTTFEIDEPEAITITGSITDVSCFQAADGTINITVGGGSGTYTFTWSNTSTTEDISGLAGNSYSVIVVDTAGCTENATFTVDEPDSLSMDHTLSEYSHGYNISVTGESDGSIDVTMTGGTLPYTYSWSNGTSNEDLEDAPAGTYTLTVVDANGCDVTYTFTLTEPPPINPANAFSPNSDGRNDYWVVENIEEYTGNSVVIFNRWGDMVYKAAPYNNDWDGTTTNVRKLYGQNLPDGSYFYLLTLENGVKPVKGYIVLKR